MIVPFSNLPIRWKLTLVIVGTSVLALVLTCGIFVTYEWVTYRREALGNLTTIGRLIADNSTAALGFDNPGEATELLATLRAEQAVTVAALYDTQGRLFATYAPHDTPPTQLDPIPVGNFEFRDGYLHIYQAVVQNNHRLGTLFISSNLEHVRQRFLLYAALATLVLVGCGVVAGGLANFLQLGITRPIYELAQTARLVSAQRQYSARARIHGTDELGELTETFNDMLAQIEERDQRLLTSEERLHTALSAADMGTWRLDPRTEDETRDANLNRLLGREPRTSHSKWEERLLYVHPEDRPVFRAALHRTLADGSPFFAEYRIVRNEGAVRWMRDRGKAVRLPQGDIDYLTGAAVDITDRKEAEEEVRRLNSDLEQRVTRRTAELAQTNKELEAFIYSVSHDLRAPLRHVTNYSQILQADHGAVLPEEVRYYLGRIGKASSKMNQLIDDLLNLSRVSRQPLVLQRTDLNQLVDDALIDLEPELQNRRIEWQRASLPIARCDPGLIRLVFTNLLSNALKYSRPREVAHIAIGTTPIENGLAIFVRDDGVGFDARYQHKLFGVFQRLHGSAFEGTGVGLATVERIMRNHGGRIWAESQLDHGATFYFTLPGLAA
ncbi:PAS domain-containing protein [Horticoccus luteus]|uniref:histidine kinase n=1 Tax=Horticoccus luteus TaxID=2862869 RepID=A0A8F9TRL2_9BACT|nr:ATP-binding protein [Horticoccus luteus]QYM77909.1 PAS domain-containing protein [Horticoccus luteus]